MWHSRAFHRLHDPRPPHVASGRLMLLMVATGLLLCQSWRCVSRKHGARRDAKPVHQLAPLHTWEGEGGRPDPEPPRSDTAPAA